MIDRAFMIVSAALTAGKCETLVSAQLAMTYVSHPECGIQATRTDRRHMPWFCLSRTSVGIPRPGRLRPRVRKVAAMRHMLDALDVLSYRSTNGRFCERLRYVRRRGRRSATELSVERHDPARWRPDNTVDPGSELAFWLLHRRMRRRQRDASSLPR
jgi:hypothetical protein